MSRTTVDAERYVFVSDYVEPSGLQRSVAVHWAANPFSVDGVLDALHELLSVRHEVAEVWFVYPSDIENSALTLLGSEEFQDRIAGADQAFRFFQVDGAGAWTEVVDHSGGSNDRIVSSRDLTDFFCVDGSRQLFRDSDALASAGAGLHFRHPSGTHSAQFIRSSHAAARIQHAYFLAMLMLSKVTVDRDMSFWADTAGIFPVLFALRDLSIRLNRHNFSIRIDSFAGYDGLIELNPVPDTDYVFVSSTTSGGLARRALEEKAAQSTRILTLFAVSREPLPPEVGTVICDLTNRDAHSVPSVRDARISPYQSFKPVDGNGCDFCDRGIGLVELEGDGFFPRANELSLRVLKRDDRPWTQTERRPRARFDGDDYFVDFYALDAIMPGHIDASYDTGLRFGHVLDQEHVRGRLLEHVERLVEKRRFAAVIAMPDRESRALAAFVAANVDSSFVEHVGDVWASPSLNRSEGRADLFAQLPAGTDVLMCAGVIASGRLVLAESRATRPHTNLRWSYLIGAAHPESPQTWDILLRTLGVQSSGNGTLVECVWNLPREPRPFGMPNAWRSESILLERMASDTDLFPAAEFEAIQNRLNVTQGDTADRLLAGAEGGPIADVNPMFALWPFEWSDPERTERRGVSVVPTQSEVYATVAHLMAESRRTHIDLGGSPTTIRKHGVALNPSVFDRFNDPIIQACILRSARAGELDYHSDHVASRAMAGVLLHVLAEVGRLGGDAAYEFMLSIALALELRRGDGLRLADGVIVNTIEIAEARRSGESWPDLLSAMIRFVRHRLTAVV